MTIQTIPLEAIQPPHGNPRSAIEPAALEGLAASIRQDGLLQNLVVTRGRGKHFRLVSGERRYRALMLLQERGEIEGGYAVPVEIRGKLGKEEALRLATVENAQRENLPPLDEAKAFAALIRKGGTLDDLAAKTGLSPATIRRRLALNELCEEAKAALTAGEIGLAQCEALTLGSHDAQRLIIAEIGRGHADFSAAAIREHLLDDRPTVAMAIFPLDRYEGTITTDLFAEGETSYFDDPDRFFELQQEAVEKLAREHEGKAAWVEVTDAHRLPEWQYEDAADGEPGGVVINLSPSGRVEIREGLARPESDPDTRAATADNPAAPGKVRAAYPMPLRRLIGWHKSAAIQELLLGNPRKAREIGAVERIVNLHAHEALRHLEKAGETGSACGIIGAEARRLAGLLGFALEDERPLWGQFPPKRIDELALYEAVQALSDSDLERLHTLLAALAFGQDNCERLDTRDSLFNRVARDLAADMRNHWRPSRSFFEKRSREQLAAIAVDCGYGLSVGAMRSRKKGELVNALLRHLANAHAAAEPSPAQIRARSFLPEAMLFPAVDPDAKDGPAAPAEDDQDEDEELAEAA